MAPELLEQCKRQRTNIKRNITRIKNLINTSIDQNNRLSNAELQCRLGILESYFKQAMTVQSEIENMDPTDTGRGDLEDSYIEIKVSITDQLGEEFHSTRMERTSLSPGSPNVFVSSSSKLPRLSLPTFDGKLSEYKNFIHSFNQLIANEPNMSNLEKFNHLLNCLKGVALDTVKAFQVTEENYAKVIDRLNKRFDNPTLIFLETISSLFKLPQVEKASAVQLQKLVDSASAMYGSLQSLGTGSEIAQAMLIYLVMDKCDQQTRTKWNESLDFKRLPSWSQCSQILEQHCRHLQSNSSTLHSGAQPFKPNKSGQRSSFLIVDTACAVCSATDHKVQACSKFQAMSSLGRFDAVKRLNLCINCLGHGHRMNQCPSKNRCRICKHAHHTMLHHDKPSPVTQSSPEALSTQATQLNEQASHTHVDDQRSQVILATAVILVKDASGSYRLGRALLDSCSQVNFITMEFAQKLRLYQNKQNIGIRSIGDTLTTIKSLATTSVKSRICEYKLPLQFCVTTHIAYQPDSEIDISSWKLPANIPLADEKFYQSGRIDLLLGTEAFFEVLAVGQIKLAPNLPILQKTLFGWVASGRYRESQQAAPVCLLSSEATVDENIQKLWELESISKSSHKILPEHKVCELSFINTTVMDGNNRIVVALPFKDSPNRLGDSAEIARRRFLAMERRMLRNPEICSQYVAFMKEYQNMGHMSLVPNPNLCEPHYYIPHHCVLKPNSSTTKLRVVFDASCATTSQLSLNDLLFVGPKLQSDLYLLLLKFRLFRYAITADVTKMYRQVLIDPNYRKYQYIFWRDSPDADVQTFQLNTVTYGTAAAPYLAVRSLHYLADMYTNELPLGSTIVKSSFYVDDLLSGADDTRTLHSIKNEVTEVLRRGNFPLTKWHSNHPDFMNTTPTKQLNMEEEYITSALGVSWEQLGDVFRFTFEPKQSITAITKRSILSVASTLFDPLGLLSPIIIVAKMILQELWLLHITWDESVPQALHDAWKQYIASLEELPTISVPRYCMQPNSTNIQLHGFCDASIRAYGCCIYLRTQGKDNKIAVQLWTAKSRVAPVRKQSLPKLELCAAHLLARLLCKTKELLDGQEITTFLWSDSQIVLHWIKQHSVTLSTFVGNRISEIQDLTSKATWRFVPTQCNPADIVSRGCSVSELVLSDWFTGPKFLYKEASEWPIPKTIKIDMDVVNIEKRKQTFTMSIASNRLLDILETHSSFVHCQRLVAWLLRFIKACKSPLRPKNSTLSPEELEQATSCIIWNLQRTYYQDEILQLRSNKMLKGPLKFLAPFLDHSNGYELIKVGGRLDHADLPENEKHPILLPNKSSFTEKYVQYLHIRNFHAGPKALIALLRLRFWVINARSLSRRIVRSCIHCVRYRPTLMKQLMGSLPKERVTVNRPFSKCGVDFCGPIPTYLRIRGKPPTKSYLAVFICLSIKAVHIEVVTDLTTDAFIAALKRFSGRRGLPTDIYCDNATNFVGGANQLKELKNFLFNKETKNAIQAFCLEDFINFHFIPPRAPHFGGLWEAAVKSAKGLLYRTFQNTRFTYEELSTIVVEIEAILNSRPLSPLSSDPNDLGALTAGHFLIGNSLRSLPDRTIEVPNISHLQRFEATTALKQSFWRRWSRDYLNELRSRTKWTSPSPNITVGAMVLVHEDNLPPLQWKMGRVESVVYGQDNQVRVARIRMANGTCCRPIHKLALLPVS